MPEYTATVKSLANNTGYSFTPDDGGRESSYVLLTGIQTAGFGTLTARIKVKYEVRGGFTEGITVWDVMIA